MYEKFFEFGIQPACQIMMHHLQDTLNSRDHPKKWDRRLVACKGP